MNRVSVTRRIAALLLATLATAAMVGPETATYILGFSATEQHTTFLFASPGFLDVPEAHARLDNDPTGFDLLASNGKPIEFKRDKDGRIECRQLEVAARAFRMLSLVMSNAWLTDGSDARITVSQVANALGNDAWTETATADCHTVCELETLVESTRFLRIQPTDLAGMDQNRDQRIDRNEFAGSPMTSPHILGTDALGRDVVIRLLNGLRLSLIVGLTAAFAAAVFGIAWGITAAMSGGIVELVMMRIVDVVYGLPFIFVVILIVSIFGPSTLNLLLAIAAVQWLTMARTVRAVTASILKTPYIEAARVLGCGPVRLAYAHVLPNARRPILAWAALLVPAAIKEEAFLSFLGLGIQAPAASLGTLIADGIGSISQSPWLVAAPSLTIFFLVASITLLSDNYSKNA